MPRRLGPQPLPLHLSLALATWSNSAAVLPSLMLAWQHLKNQQAQDDGTQNRGTRQAAASPLPPGSAQNPPLRLPASLAQALQKLGPQLDAADPVNLAKALSNEGHRRLDAFLTGTLAYRRQTPAAKRISRPAIWSSGSTRLLDYRSPSMLAKTGDAAAGDTAPRLLVIPSLINRYYILDLAPETSFLDFLATAGCHPFVIDWGAPGEVERGFTLSDYIAGRLQEAYRALQQQPGGPIVLVGYCMGGLLALALAQLLVRLKESDLAGLVLLATPWDFHAEQGDHAAMIAALGHQLDPVMTALGELPVDLLQAFFALLDPFQVPRKFQGFAQLRNGVGPDEMAIKRFTLLEDWLNDGVGLAADVARECLIGWYGTNSTQKGLWRVGDNIVDPTDVTIPCLAMIPNRDRIVPPGSALALARALPIHDIEMPPAGHIGMMAGTKARTEVWPRIADWVKQRCRA
jgi:polyhydroxyalkanoate synthase